MRLCAQELIKMEMGFTRILGLVLRLSVGL